MAKTTSGSRVRSCSRVQCSFSKRVVYIDGPITRATFFKVGAAFIELEKGGADPIAVIIGHSHGGSAVAGMMIFALLRHALSPVYTFVRDVAMSAAFLIFLGGSKRFMLPCSRVSPHRVELTVAGGTYNEDELKALWRMSAQHNLKWYRVTREIIHKPIAIIRQLYAKNELIGSRDAVQLGLATEIMPARKFINLFRECFKK